MRNRIGKDLEKSATGGSLITTDTSNEPFYLAPDVPNKLLNLNSSNLPEWTDSPTINGEMRLTRQINGETGRILSLEVDGLVTAMAPLMIYSNMYSVTGAPTVTLNSGAGTSGTPTYTLLGSNDTGLITVTTGNTPATGADIAVIAFDSLSYPVGASVVLFPASSTTIAADVYAVATTGGWVIKSGAIGLTALTAYEWNYIVKGY